MQSITLGPKPKTSDSYCLAMERNTTNQGSENQSRTWNQGCPRKTGQHSPSHQEDREAVEAHT